MRALNRLALYVVFLVTVTACGVGSPLPAGDDLVAQAQQAWMGDWHAVWQVEWVGAPVRGPLVAEIWHAADGRLRIETLEAPTPALSGLALADDGQAAWLWRLNQNGLEAGVDESERIPLVSDGLDTMGSLLSRAENASVKVAGRDMLETGPAVRLDIVLEAGDRAAMWIDERTGFPSRVELRSATLGEASFAIRRIQVLEPSDPALFVPPAQDPL